MGQLKFAFVLAVILICFQFHVEGQTFQKFMPVYASLTTVNNSSLVIRGSLLNIFDIAINGWPKQSRVECIKEIVLTPVLISQERSRFP